MTGIVVPEAIWTDEDLDTLDKLILALIANGGDTRTPDDIALELKTTKKRVTQKINRMSKEGRLTLITTGGTTRMEVHNNG